MKNLGKVNGKVVNEMVEVVNGEGIVEMVKKVNVVNVGDEKSFLDNLKEIDVDSLVRSKRERESEVKKGSKSEGYLYLMREKGKDLKEVLSIFNSLYRGSVRRNELRKEGKLEGEFEKEVKVYYSEVERVWKNFIKGGYGDKFDEEGSLIRG